jgi:hypothetical protein
MLGDLEIVEVAPVTSLEVMEEEGAMVPSQEGLYALPVWCLPPKMGTATTLSFSLVQQIDGLLHRCQGVRLERDVCASSQATAVCEIVGMEAFESAGAFCGFYHSDDITLMAPLVAMVASHRGLGVFVVPAESDGVAVIQPEPPPSAARAAPLAEDWLQFLLRSEVMRFLLPQEGFTARHDR